MGTSLYKEEVVTSKLLTCNNFRQNTDETLYLDENRYSPAKFKRLQTLHFFLFHIWTSLKKQHLALKEGNKSFESFPKFGHWIKFHHNSHRESYEKVKNVKLKKKTYLVHQNYAVVCKTSICVLFNIKLGTFCDIGVNSNLSLSYIKPDTDSLNTSPDHSLKSLMHLR